VQLVVLIIPIAGIVLMLLKVGAGGVRYGWRKTDGRPVRRALFSGAVFAVLGLLLFAWVPADNYHPIRPGERGTVGEGVAAARRLPTGKGPLYSEQQAEVRQAQATTPVVPQSDQTPVAPSSSSTTPSTPASATSTTNSSASSTTTTSSSTTSSTSTTTTTPSTTTTTGP
jgi:hypothetical protein